LIRIADDMERLELALLAATHVVFDLDGTLYDTRDYERPALSAVCAWLRERSGDPLPDAERDLWLRRETDRHRPGLFDELLHARGFPADWGSECAARFHSDLGIDLANVPSLKPLLETLRVRGCSLALVSNGRRELQQRKLSSLGMNGMFDQRVFCEPSRPAELKPSNWAWQQLREWRGPARAIHVGDDPVDAAFAAAGDAGFVHFCFRSETYAD
jgi:FMN phosphatase YigB (HAD superfamily)